MVSPISKELEEGQRNVFKVNDKEEIKMGNKDRKQRQTDREKDRKGDRPGRRNDVREYWKSATLEGGKNVKERLLSSVFIFPSFSISQQQQ